MDEFSAPRIIDVDPLDNLNDLFASRVAAGPDQPMVEVKSGPGAPWKTLTAREVDADVVSVAKGLVALGIQPGEHVGIMSRTRYEWTLLDWATWAAGAVPVPLYETSSAEQVQWILSDAGVRLLVVESPAHAATVEEVRAQAPELGQVFVIDDGGIAALKEAGKDVSDDEIARRRGLANLADVATIIYTSGTTGRPKGAELTHENFYSLTVNAVKALPEVFAEANGRTLLFMPLAHVFARFIGVLVVAGGTVLGHTPDTKTLLEDLGEFKPTYILSVPRVFEKVYNSSEQKAAAGGKVKIFHWAAATAIAYSRALDDPKGPGIGLKLQHKVADALVYKKLRAALGGQTKWAVSGGAPLGERLGHFYRGIGVRILEGYGLTETTAPTSVNRPTATKIGTVGPQLPGCGARIAEDGEILLKGHHVFRGYHNNPQATQDAFVDGWFRTGDLGSLDADGFLRITGRKKEIIVTAGGKNVAPAVLEDRIRAHALVSQCVVVGDGQPFIGALMTIDPEGLPGWLAMHGKEPMTVEAAAIDVDVLAALDTAVDRANKAVSRAESIRKFTILTTDFTVENGYLTPSLKVKRNVVLQDFSVEVDAIYAGAAAH
ncbi:MULTISPECIES: AMP-dependent synthetase/ligase [Oerskovia]|uniref:Acyl-CoA synthetase n=1 Tax=Oerskovia enterophila TaxID=43678 RepID=A0A163T897_9CELL|nr:MULTISPECIES: AMP-dependent synthetase/ligase [Oerskovia]KRC35637.1 long-chain fatty acid--CoA ligase [Oerskovia sp. Root22]KRD36595.1 long-chain fatty acid--CoA ligase [Oerskovia sp. Root918]KZM37222.1 long-chain-fatty-acid--CoA ligase FadD15 [Oerskovia enterophila]OCI32293.1 long-chain-fatty-acid--CoA ligase FadD15 [Oerskovia enterophila]